jgi:hypothetical protein
MIYASFANFGQQVWWVKVIDRPACFPAVAEVVAHGIVLLVQHENANSGHPRTAAPCLQGVLVANLSRKYCESIAHVHRGTLRSY